jgi:hypothetical protein
MKNSEIVANIHGFVIFYLLFGGIFYSQRGFLIWFLPTLQYQFLVNNNTCLLTQLEDKLKIEEKSDDNKDDNKDDKIKSEGFVDGILKKHNIVIESDKREMAIHTIVYLCFLGNYFYM